MSDGWKVYHVKVRWHMGQRWSQDIFTASVRLARKAGLKLSRLARPDLGSPVEVTAEEKKSNS